MRQATAKLRDKKGSFLLRILFGVYTLFLFTVTLLPTDVMSSDGKSWLAKLSFQNGDKIVHFALFFLYTFLWYVSGYAKKKYSIWLVPLFVGLFIEILQNFIGLGRTFDVWDITANSIGIFLAFLILSKNF